MSRVTADEELADINATPYPKLDGLVSNRTIVDMAAELRERRAADLSDEERGALRVFVADMKRSEMRSPDIMYYPPHLLEVRRVLDRLLSHAGGDK